MTYGNLMEFGNDTYLKTLSAFFSIYIFCPEAHARYDGPGTPGLPRGAFYHRVGGADSL